MNTTLPENLAESFALVSQALRSHKATADLEYYGSGDSGESFDVRLSETDHAMVAGMNLKDAVNIVLERIIWKIHPGYEINDGGGGDVFWHPDGMLQASCRHYIQGEDCDGVTVDADADYSSTPSTPAESVAINTGRILDAIKASGIGSIEVEYEGSSDSGGVTETSLPKDADPIHLDIWVYQSVWTSDAGHKTTFTLQRMTLEDAARSVAEDVVACNFRGYEINEGGRGDVEFSLEANAVHVNHVGYSTDSEYQNFVMVDPSLSNAQALALMRNYVIMLDHFHPLNDAQQALHEKMQQQGLDALLLEYGCVDVDGSWLAPEDAQDQEDAPRG